MDERLDGEEREEAGEVGVTRRSRTCGTAVGVLETGGGELVVFNSIADS